MRSAFTFAVLLAASLVACNHDDDTGPGPDDQQQVALRLSIHPQVAGQGTSLDVTMEANRTVFEFGATEFDLGQGVTIDSVTVIDNYEAVARVHIDPDADLGMRDATITIEGDESVLEASFEVIAESFFLDPDNGKMGETLYVAMVGSSTEWQEGYTWTSFGDGVEILEFSVLSPGLAEARISIRPDAPPGPRDVMVENGPHVVTLYDGFIVDRAVITAFWDPPQAYQGQTVAYTITGLDTAFSTDTLIEFWDDGGINADIQVIEQRVIDAENMYGRIRLSNAARLGYRDVLLTTGDEAILVPDALEVLDAPPDLSNVIPATNFDIYRSIDNATGDLLESVEAFAYFIIPLNPPCGAAPPMGDGPMPYDNNGVWPIPPPPEPVDCPDPETVSAGDFVWYEGPENVVTLHKDIIQSSGQIIYWGIDLTLDDYHFDTVYDLHTQGDPDGIPEVLVEAVQPTVPADYYLISPEFWGDLTVSRYEDFNYEWTPAQTYPDAIFGTQITGSLVVDDEPGFAGCIPWDDGVHTYTPNELSQLNPGPVSFSAYSYIQGRYWGLPFSTVQSQRSDSVLSTEAFMILE
ncbi:MAG: hypothetical protein JRI25_11675 [Deltaproteobacteria bacterium]|nr:hypothetical protein [Deltaproteobacteria bacterium]MBW2255245.1 hypothetical protein [Deltaproteobacteria bacterium]